MIRHNEKAHGVSPMSLFVIMISDDRRESVEAIHISGFDEREVKFF